VFDETEQRLISDAEIAEVPFTAFTSRRKADHISGRLIVRRVKRLNPASKTAQTSKTATGGDEQGELFALYRYHAVFTDSPLTLVQAEKTHRAHAIIEQVHADLRSGQLAHLPDGSFPANSAWLVLAAIAASAWLVLAAIAFNLTRAAGTLASTFHAKATTGTIRAQLINVPARLARSARRLRIHLPERWPWEPAWNQLFQATLGPPNQPDPTTRHKARTEPKWKSRTHRPLPRAHNRQPRPKRRSQHDQQPDGASRLSELLWTCQLESSSHSQVSRLTRPASEGLCRTTGTAGVRRIARPPPAVPAWVAAAPVRVAPAR